MSVSCGGQPSPGSHQPESSASQIAVANEKAPAANTRKLVLRTERHPDGSRRAEGKVYVDGEGSDVRHGVWTEWYAGEQKALETTYVDGEENGPVTAWYPDGAKRASGAFRRGKAHGAVTQWYPHGKKMSVDHYSDGVKNGVFQTWYESGQESARWKVRSGVLDGGELAWFPNGQKMLEKSYKNGLVEGTSTAWYASGGKQWQLEVRSGKPHGPFVRWYPSGQKWLEGGYVNAQPAGKWRVWFASGKERFESEIEAGQVKFALVRYENGNKKGELRRLASGESRTECWSKRGKKEKCRREMPTIGSFLADYEAEPKGSKDERESFGEMYINRLAANKDEFCACTDKECTRTVDGHMDKFAWEFSGMKPSQAAETHLHSIGREIQACRVAIGAKYEGLYKQ
jgi:antitoxin component YwqK of YwqJK toxin-antitoxin module